MGRRHLRNRTSATPYPRALCASKLAYRRPGIDYFRIRRLPGAASGSRWGSAIVPSGLRLPHCRKRVAPVNVRILGRRSPIWASGGSRRLPRATTGASHRPIRTSTFPSPNARRASKYAGDRAEISYFRFRMNPEASGRFRRSPAGRRHWPVRTSNSPPRRGRTPVNGRILAGDSPIFYPPEASGIYRCEFAFGPPGLRLPHSRWRRTPVIMRILGRKYPILDPPTRRLPGASDGSRRASPLARPAFDFPYPAGPERQ